MLMVARPPKADNGMDLCTIWGVVGPASRLWDYRLSSSPAMTRQRSVSNAPLARHGYTSPLLHRQRNSEGPPGTTVGESHSPACVLAGSGRIGQARHSVISRVP